VNPKLRLSGQHAVSLEQPTGSSMSFSLFFSRTRATKSGRAGPIKRRPRLRNPAAESMRWSWPSRPLSHQETVLDKPNFEQNNNSANPIARQRERENFKLQRPISIVPLASSVFLKRRNCFFRLKYDCQKSASNTISMRNEK